MSWGERGRKRGKQSQREDGREARERFEQKRTAESSFGSGRRSEERLRVRKREEEGREKER